MSRTKTIAVLFATFALAAAVAGCSTARPSVSAAGSASSAMDQLVPVDSAGVGQLAGVSVGPSHAPIVARDGSPEQLVQKRYVGQVDIGVFESTRGVQTKLVVPMWYGKQTAYSVAGGKSVPLAAAVADKTVIWWGSGSARVRYHLENGAFVLDTLDVDMMR